MDLVFCSNNIIPNVNFESAIVKFIQNRLLVQLIETLCKQLNIWY